MVTNVARSLWAQSRATGATAWRPTDVALVLVMVPVAALETVLRTDVAWPAASFLVTVVLAFALPWRRSHPLTTVAVAFGTVAAVEIVALVQDVEWEGLYTMIVALALPYSLFRWGTGREAVAGLGVIMVPTTLSVLDESNTVGDAIGGLVIVCLAGAVGAVVRYEVTSRARELDQVKLREREQLARELHDTVAHHVSAIAVRAQAGRALAGTRPEAAVEALDVIEDEASRTLAEMRAMVGALRQGEEPELAPQRGVTDIERLATVSGDGPRVEVTIANELRDLRPSVDAAVYRLAQESITNALRHARHATRVDVRVSGDDEVVRLTVQDDGEPGTSAAASTGYGLVGMAERAKLLGGTLEAGPADGRGWTVDVVLPRGGAPR